MRRNLPIVLSYLTLFLTMAPSAFAAPSHEPETYTRLTLAAGGYYYAGNLNQLQGNIQGHLGLSSPTFGADVLTNGYRLWTKSSRDADYQRVGDDFYVTALPFWYFTPQLYLAGVGRYESSRVLQLEHRLVTGTGLGIAPVRTKEWLIRVAVLPSFEWAEFPNSNFRSGVEHSGVHRQVFRAAIISNGWYRPKNGALSYRYFAQLWPNALDLDDIRANIVANMDFRIADPISFRFSGLFTYDNSILQGRENFDLRSTFGIAFKML